MITTSLITALISNLDNPNVWAAALEKVCSQYSIEDNNNRLSMFLAQTMYESSNFKYFVEDLDYTSVQRLLMVFPTHFSGTDDAAAYVGNPQAIANRVYANRDGNGDEASGDGWAFRGRGLIQLTGRTNYTNFANSIGMDLGSVTSYMETPEGASMAAGWYWSTNGLNGLADQDEFTLITERINGGTNGIEQRKAIWTTVQGVLASQSTGSTPSSSGSS